MTNIKASGDIPFWDFAVMSMRAEEAGPVLTPVFQFLPIAIELLPEQVIALKIVRERHLKYWMEQDPGGFSPFSSQTILLV